MIDKRIFYLMMFVIFILMITSCGRLDTNGYYTKRSVTQEDIHYCEVKQGNSLKLVRCEEDQ